MSRQIGVDITPAPAPQKTEKGTAYVVLEQGAGQQGQPHYTLIAKFTATSANAAIRAAGEDAGPGTYIAVPARSFQPVKVTVETTKTVKLG